MTVKKSLLKVVTPAKAGVQALIWAEVKCCSNYETVNNLQRRLEQFSNILYFQLLLFTSALATVFKEGDAVGAGGG